MSKQYICSICNYSTDRMYSMNRHTTTKKHILKNKNILQDKVVLLETKKYKCEFCDKSISSKRHLQRHYKVCKIKKNTDNSTVISNLIKNNNELLNDKKRIEEDYFKLTKKIITNSSPHQFTINNTTLNMYYVIDNFTEAYNLEDLITPELTDSEIEYIASEGATAGCFNLLKTRCIDNIDINKRPFHCVDISRSKYLLRTNDDWEIDYRCAKILSTTYPVLRKLYPVDMSMGTDTIVNNINTLLEMEGKGSKKIISNLNNKTLLKNNV